jgi:O-antigen ligase
MAFSRGAWLGLATGTAVYFSTRPLPNEWKRRALNLSLIALFCGGILGPLLAVHDRPFTDRTLLQPLSQTLTSSRRQHTRPLLSFSQRPLYWQAAESVLKQHPFFGLGPGNYARYIQQYLPPNQELFFRRELRAKGRIDFWMHLHNLYLQVATIYGFVGYFFWALAMIGLILPGIRRFSSESQTFWQAAMMISLLAFLVHNLFDVLTVNSLDLIFAVYAVQLRQRSSA